jgi:hypothetical protein
MPTCTKSGEGTGEVAGPGDVRAGEPDLKQPFVLAFGERLPGPHDPGGDLAGAGDVGPDRLAVPARRAARCLRTTWRPPR